MKKSTLILISCSLVASFAIGSCTSSSTENKVEQPSEKALYQCPMDCEHGKTYTEKVTCPVCGMDLEKADSSI
jgi:hypothetical protein